MGNELLCRNILSGVCHIGYASIIYVPSLMCPYAYVISGTCICLSSISTQEDEILFTKVHLRNNPYLLKSAHYLFERILDLNYSAMHMSAHYPSATHQVLRLCHIRY